LCGSPLSSLQLDIHPFRGALEIKGNFAICGWRPPSAAAPPSLLKKA